MRIKPTNFLENKSENKELSIFSATDEIGKTVCSIKSGVGLRLVENYFHKEEEVDNIKDVFSEKIKTFRFNSGVFNIRSE